MGRDANRARSRPIDESTRYLQLGDGSSSWSPRREFHDRGRRTLGVVIAT